MEPEDQVLERNNIPPIMGYTLNDVSVIADHFEPDIEISEEV
jgi:hypothetical protein